MIAANYTVLQKISPIVLNKNCSLDRHCNYLENLTFYVSENKGWALTSG